MQLYVVTSHLDPIEVPHVFPVSFQNAWSMDKLSPHRIDATIDMMEEQWNQYRAVTFVFRYMESRNYYYFLTPTIYPANEHYMIYSFERDLHERWYHPDFYSKPILKQWSTWFQQRIRTRAQLEEYSVMEDVALHEELSRMIKWNFWDTSLIRRQLKEVEERIEEEKRYRPDGAGAEEARREFEACIKFDTSR